MEDIGLEADTRNSTVMLLMLLNLQIMQVLFISKPSQDKKLLYIAHRLFFLPH